MTTIQQTGPQQPAPPARPTKGYKGLGMEGFLARWYAQTTAGQPARYRQWMELVTGKLPDGGTVLEVAPGPGYLAIELAKLGNYRVVGLDISRTFVEIARKNAKDAGVAVTFMHGNAACMPFEPCSFDVLVCTAAFKNFAEPVQAISEMHRVLRPGGKAVIVDLRPDASPEAVNAEVAKMGLGWLNSLMVKLTFKYLLLKRAYSQEQFRQMASQTPFMICEIHEEPLGLAVWLAK
jgi:ubiquinone/menaquinone biosynthesis C-methylase UbiE